MTHADAVNLIEAIQELNWTLSFIAGTLVVFLFAMIVVWK